MFTTDFEFLSKPWWRPAYDNRLSSFFIEDTKQRQHAVSLAFIEVESEFWEGYSALHCKKYLLECLSGEGNIVDLDYDRIEMLLDIDPDNEPDRGTSHAARKVQNLLGAINSNFPSILFPTLSIEKFTPNLAQEIHRQVGGGGLINNAGQYRTNWAKAAQEENEYMDPHLINDSMNNLFSECQEKFSREDLQFEEAIKLGACFLTHFLHIHPFSNGNGRVARLLLSYLLAKFTVVPVSLYLDGKGRDAYLECLRQSQRYQETPDALAALLLECVHRAIYIVCVALDIDVVQYCK